MKKFIYIIFILFSLVLNSYASEKYNGIIDIDINKSIISGAIKILSDKNTIISLNVDKFYDIAIDGNKLKINTDKIDIALKKDIEKTITFKKNFQDYDVINDDFLSLFNITPIIENSNIKTYSINFSLPKKYTVISAGEDVLIKENGNNNDYTYTMYSQISTFDIIASSKYHIYKEKYNNIEVTGYFFNENKDLAKSYIEATINYIKKYENLLQSPFPYKRFSVVEHIEPFGYAVPTYTVLGSKVIRLPFIISTSLGHEVMHQWFGTAIEKKGNSNWFEAITTYFTDLGNLPTEDEKIAYRKNLLVSYYNYMANNFDYPLKDFKYNDSKKSQSVGYGKGAMLFQMINSYLGDEEFLKGIRKFVKNHMYKSASWDDIFNSFDNKNVKEFADFYLKKPIEPEIFVNNSYFSVENAENHITFDVFVKNSPKNLTVPYTLIYDNFEEKGKITLKEGMQNISIKVKNKNVKLILDKDYEVIRHLTKDEKPSALSAFFYSKNIIGINDDIDSCQNFFNGFSNISVKHYKDTSLIDFANNNVVICNFENPIIKTFTSNIKVDKKADSQYSIFKNPFSEDNFILAINNPLDENIRLLRHYGKYAYLQFKGDKNIEKVIDSTDNGIEVFVGKEDVALNPASIKSIKDIVKVAKLYPVIFVGEHHDNYAHHLNQLEIIKELYSQDKKIAVGFEMIQKQFQPVLDDYIKGNISEYEFLKQVDYYNRWSFDYNLYAPIFRYLRENKIPAIALNIDNTITKKISQGNANKLTTTEISQLPKEMNIPNKFYEKTLRKIFNLHPPQNKKRNFTNFFLVQNIWDEVMAESIVNFQKKYRNYKVVAIVGQGHLNKETGIPLRYKRLTGNDGFVITQDDNVNNSFSDTIIFTNEVYSKGTPKIGVSVKEENNQLIVAEVSKNSPSEKAGIKVGDILTQCGKYKIDNIGDLKYLLFETGYGKNIDCQVKRKNQNLKIKINLFEYSQDFSSIHKNIMGK